MPKKRRRHTITEEGEVADALARVRAVGGDVDLRRLVVLGADAFVEKVHGERQHNRERRARLRERLIARTTRSGAVDLAAAGEVRKRGWAREPNV